MVRSPATAVARVPAVDAAAALAAASDALILELVGFQSLLNLRGRPDDEAFVSAVAGKLGLWLPVEANTCNKAGERVALWLGPDEWLVVAPDGQSPMLEDAFRAALGDDPWLSVTDVSHSYTALRLRGEDARNVLAKGCPIDLHPQSFGPGHCAQTIVAGSRVLLSVEEDPMCFIIRVRNSFARYITGWLADAMLEFHR